MTTKQLFSAILMNVFILPGAGQIHLKKRKRGYLFIIATSILLIVFTFHVSSLVSEMLSQFKTTTSIMAMATNMKSDLLDQHGGTLSFYLFSILAVYLYSIVDTVLLYRREKEET